MKLTLHYSVQNCGDGSAYPKFLESEELAEWDQDHMDEGWGEPCTGTITIEGDNLTCTEVETKEGYYLDLILDRDPMSEEEREEAKEFKAKFFPNGLPRFTVGISRKQYYGILVTDRVVYEYFAYPEKTATQKGVKKLERRLEKLLKEE